MSQSRALRFTVDHNSTSPRMIRAYYSSNSSFSRMTEMFNAPLPSALVSAAAVTVGFASRAVSLNCVNRALALRRLPFACFRCAFLLRLGSP